MIRRERHDVTDTPAPSEYDVVLGGEPGEDTAAEQVRAHFAAAAAPYLSTPLLWLAWAAILPAAALATPRALAAGGWPAALVLWSVAILLGGAAEWLALRGRVRRRPALAGWALRVQGNLSLVAVALSAALVVAGRPDLLPALWLLALGHSLYALGGLAFPPMRTAGLLYQAGGLAALWPAVPGLIAFALTTGIANLWLAWSVRRQPDPARGGS